MKKRDDTSELPYECGVQWPADGHSEMHRCVKRYNHKGRCKCACGAGTTL